MSYEICCANFLGRALSPMLPTACPAELRTMAPAKRATFNRRWLPPPADQERPGLPVKVQ